MSTKEKAKSEIAKKASGATSVANRKAMSVASKYSRSTASSRKSVKSAKMEAVFRAELAAMDQEDVIELKEAAYQLEIKREQKKLRRLQKVAEFAKIIQEAEDEDDDDASGCAASQLDDIPVADEEENLTRFFDSQKPKTTNTKAQVSDLPGESSAQSPCSSETKAESGWEKVADSLAQIAQFSLQQSSVTQQLAVTSQLPKLDIPIFHGDPIDYTRWKNAFDGMIDAKPLNAATKLSYLSKYVAGEPKEVVEHFLLLGTSDAYQRAKDLLAERYGNASVVSMAFTTKLKSWPYLSERDPIALRAFSDFLEKVVAAKSTVGSLGILDFPQENFKLVAKLPAYLENQWRDEIDKWQQAHGADSYPPFTKFSAFVKKAAKKANIPELEGVARERRSYQSSKAPRGHTFATSGHVDQRNPRLVKHGMYMSCPFCNLDHHLDDCEEFMNITLSDRKKFFFAKMLCMGCASTDDHLVKACSDRRDCKICNGKHLTCLHYGSKPKHKPDQGLSNCTSVCTLLDQDGPDHCMIVPVWVRRSGDPSKEFLQYAILDDQSNVGFISNNLCKKLNVNGPETDLILTTIHQKSNIKSKKVRGIEVLDFQKENIISLPACYTRTSIPANRSQIPKAEVVRQWPHLEKVADQLVPYNKEIEVSLLIGNNCPRAIRPREVIAGGEDHPYALRSALGWGVIGKVCKAAEHPDQAICNKTAVEDVHSHPKFTFPQHAREVLTSEKILSVLESDFKDENSSKQTLSVEDQRFLKILNTSIRKRTDGHYEMPLPFKTENPFLPYNRQIAEKRWKQLNARFRKNPKFLADYREFMSDVISTCAERAPSSYVDGKVNYVPHTGVYHPKKPQKIRVVFDCSAKYQGVSLNDHLLQGPDLTNGLLGVLCRFRQEEVALMADIRSMFHQFHVAEEDRDMLRFLWWENGDPTKPVVEYRMTVHLFGAASSPGCANFGLKRAADDGEEEFGVEAANFIRYEFYVDDGLKSVSSPQEAVSLLRASQNICAKAGLKLHKIMSNKKEVLREFPVEERSKGVADLNLDADPLPLERALGVVWCVENDTLQFRIELRDQPLTRRGILSTVCSIYDPNGFVSPVTLRGKQILQHLCRLKIDWDSDIPEDIKLQWNKWRSEVRELEHMQVRRCYKPPNFGKIKSAELHHFSDASYDGYGQCSYIRLVNDQDESSCSLVMAKSRVTPLKPVTMPRLELTAATVSAKMSAFLRRELPYPNLQEFYWTDSKVVLGYIMNEARRFHIFVANRVQLIREETDPKAWFYIDTKMNPADDASRGMMARELVQNGRWLSGPDFLQKGGAFNPHKQNDQPSLNIDDPEVKKATTLSTRMEEVSYLQSSRLQHVSSWRRATRVIALCRKFIHRLKNKADKSDTNYHVNRPIRTTLTVQELQAAEQTIIQNMQKEFLQDEWKLLKNRTVRAQDDRRERKKELKKSSSLYQLDPFLDEKDMIRVGGRISRANVPLEIKHPVILPRHSHLTVLLIRHHHQKINHMGRGMTHNQLRQSGYWVVGGSSAVSRVILECVMCRKLRGNLQQQKMAELPEDRLEPAPPFTYCGVDYFGPFTIRERRSDVKRYGVIFTCMSSRAVHLETANSLSSSSFINCLRRFLGRRGPVRQIRSDQGTAFIGARNELRDALEEMDQDRVQEYLGDNGVDWIPFELNTPQSSHMGGVWERQISTIRRALEPLLMSSGTQLDDESFRTFLTEAESIVNSRPLTTSNLCSADTPEPLTPNHLLTMKPKIVLPPPGNFQRVDSYSRKWWRRVQYLTNEFWLRWRKEFLATLQVRKKWVRPNRNIEEGDIVILKENEESRGNWPLGRVMETIPSNDGYVRKVRLLMADSSLDDKGKRLKKQTILERPVHKLVVLLRTSESKEDGTTDK